MVSSIDVARSVDEYREAVLPGVIGHTRSDAANFASSRALQVHSSGYVDGSSEMLTPLVPPMCHNGTTAGWKVISGTDEFFSATKAGA